MLYITYLLHSLLQNFFHERLKHLITKQRSLRWFTTFLLKWATWNFVIFNSKWVQFYKPLNAQRFSETFMVTNYKEKFCPKINCSNFTLTHLMWNGQMQQNISAFFLTFLIFVFLLPSGSPSKVKPLHGYLQKLVFQLGKRQETRKKELANDEMEPYHL